MSNIYKLVNSSDSLALFHQIKEISWNQMGFEMEYAKDNSDQFLIFAEDGEAGGTFEFTPYDFTNEFIKDLFHDVVTEDMVTVETDSFAVLPKYRGKLGREIVCLMIDYAEKHGYTHAIGIADPKVFESFNNTYKIESRQVKEKIFFKGAYAIPTVFNLKEVYENKHEERYAWYTKPHEKKEGVINEKH